MTFGKPLDQAGSTQLVNRCIEAGINFFDTANIYQFGVAETMLGNAMKSKRDHLVIASKVFFKMGEDADQQGLSRKAIVRAVEESLRRLGTDYLDIYYMHAPDHSVPLGESLEAMETLVKQGKVRYLASSNYASWQVVQMLGIAKDRGWHAPYISQPMYNLVARGIEQEYLPMCKAFGISTVVYNPLAGGLLTGKHKQANALRQQQALPGPLLARAVFPGRRAASQDSAVGGTVAGQPGFELATTSQRERLRDSGRVAHGAARRKPGDGGRWTSVR